MTSIQHILHFMYQKALKHSYGEKWTFWLKSQKDSSERLRIGLESILVQNTNWGNVERVKNKLREYWKKEGLIGSIWDIDWWKIVDIELLKDLIKPGGFYNQKSLYIKELAQNWHMVEQANSMVQRRKILKSIRGIGHESADAIVLYAFDEPSFVHDAYTKRVLQRTEANETNKLSNSYLAWQKYVSSNFTDEISSKTTSEAYKILHAYFIFIGNTFCHKKKPDCRSCKINTVCTYWKSENKEITNQNKQ